MCVLCCCCIPVRTALPISYLQTKNKGCVRLLLHCSCILGVDVDTYWCFSVRTTDNNAPVLGQYCCKHTAAAIAAAHRYIAPVNVRALLLNCCCCAIEINKSKRCWYYLLMIMKIIGDCGGSLVYTRSANWYSYLFLAPM